MKLENERWELNSRKLIKSVERLRGASGTGMNQETRND